MLELFKITLLSLVCVSCTCGSVQLIDNEENIMKYSQKVRLAQRDSNFVIQILTDNNSRAKTYTFSSPVSKIISTSSVYVYLMDELSSLDKLVGVTDVKYLNSDSAKVLVNRGEILDLGSSNYPDMEKLLYLESKGLELVFLSPYEMSSFERLSSNVRLFECLDYMEEAPLARAEWMRVYGRILGKGEKADSLFNLVESAYKQEHDGNKGEHSHKQSELRGRRRPKIMSELMYNGVWYVPGGRSFIAQIYLDAGADYIFADDCSSGSLAKSFEQVYERAKDADLWLFKQWGECDMNRLSLENPHYKQFEAFKKGNVYACDTSKGDYFEIATFRPDILLNEIASIVDYWYSSLTHGNTSIDNSSLTNVATYIDMKSDDTCFDNSTLASGDTCVDNSYMKNEGACVENSKFKNEEIVERSSRVVGVKKNVNYKENRYFQRLR